MVKAMVDVAADAGYLGCTLMVMNMMQCIKQACWIDDHPLLGLPHIEKDDLPHIKYKARRFDVKMRTMCSQPERLKKIFSGWLQPGSTRRKPS